MDKRHKSNPKAICRFADITCNQLHKKKTTVLAIQKTTFTKAKVLVGNFERLTNLKNLKHVFKHVIIVTLEDRSYVEISRNQSQIGK